MLIHQTIFRVVGWLAAGLVLVFLAFAGLPFLFSSIGFDIDFGRGGDKNGAGVLLRSSDGGNTWTDAGISEGRAAFPRVIFTLSSHPRESRTLFLGSQSFGLWRSDTGGVSWRQALDPSGVLDPRAYVHAVVQSPSNPNRMYVAAFQDKRGRVLKSNDGGIRFEEIYVASKDKFGVLDVKTDPDDPDRVFIATGEGGLLESKDAGRTWRAVRWFGEGIQQIIGNPASSRVFFVRTISGELWKTENGGAEWREAGSAIRDSGAGEIRIVSPFEVSPFSLGAGEKISLITEYRADPRYLLAVVNKKLFRSADAGSLWTEVAIPIASDSEELSAIAFSLESPRMIFAGAGGRLLSSVDQGASWQTHTLPTQRTVSAIFVHPREPGTMFVVLE